MVLLKNIYKKFLSVLKRLKLKNRNFTIISNNCCGGIIYNSLGERFNSPTINLFIPLEQYLDFLENLELCLNSEIVEIPNPNSQKYPVGQITLPNNKKIDIHFMHYHSFDESIKKWNERKQRIRWNNLFVFMEAGIETTDSITERFEKLPFKNKVIITNKPYPLYDSAYFIDIYDKNYTWGKLISYIPKTFKTKRYIDRFDYISWLNGKY